MKDSKINSGHLWEDEYQQKDTKPISFVVELIIFQINHSLIESGRKALYSQKLLQLNLDVLEQAPNSSIEQITNQDLQYIICFAINMQVKDIALLFNIVPASVRTARYRIKKKFGKTDAFKFLI